MNSKQTVLSGIAASFLLLLAFLPSIVCAGEYAHTYVFEQPTITTLSNGSQIAELKDTRQNDTVIGAPLLPVRTAKVFIPAEEKVTAININPGVLKPVEGTYTIQHATRPYPSSYEGPVRLDEPDPDIYSTGVDYPSIIQVERGSQYLCGNQVVVVDLNPVVYNAVRGELKYYDRIEVTIQTVWRGRPEGVMASRNLPADREQILRAIDNRNDFRSLYPGSEGQDSLYQESSTTRNYVVITTSGLMTAFQTLTNHRQSIAGGNYTTHIEDIADIRTGYSGVDDAEKMRNFIIDMYTNYGTKYVVLGGDCDGAHGAQAISTRGCYAAVGSYTDDYIPSDLYFGCLDGTWNDDGDGLWGESNDGVGGGDIDWQSEVYVGRIPADSVTEASRQIDKIIAYETSTSPFQTLLVGENLDSKPTWGGDRMDWVYGFMNSMPKTELFDRDHAPNKWPKADLLAHINSNNHGWINHLGHGNCTWNMKMGNGDVDSMTNSQYFFHYTQACYSGSIDGRNSSGGYIGGDCILEDMANRNTHGGFAIIGNSRYGWYNSGSYVQGASNLAHKEFVEAIFTDNYAELGEANQRSKTDLNLSSGVYRWIAFETNLLGCPATRLEDTIGGYGDELAVDFGANGLLHYDGSSWSKMSNWNPDDDLAGWNGGLAVDFGDNGLWNNDGSSWRKLTSWNPEDDLTDWSGGLAVDFGGNGIWNNNGSSWSKLSSWDPEDDMVGWNGGLAVDFGDNGLWNNDGSSWRKLTSWNPEDDLTDWSGGLAVDFGGNGLWNNNGSSWSKLSSWDVDSAGLTGWNGGLAIDFGGNGLWNNNGSSWSKLSSWDVDSAGLTGWSGGLAADFGNNGLWNYNGSSWTKLTSWNPDVMIGVADGLVVDFGDNGAWKYDGSSWSRLTSWNPENMDDVDLN